jgi:hypothetical protein
MTDFKPKTVYVTYIAATPEKVWQALTSSEFTRKYFWDRTIEIEPKRVGPLCCACPMAASTCKAKSWNTIRRANSR